MTDAKLAAIVCLCLLAVFTGCTERGNRAASVGADVEDTSVQDEQVRLNVNVTSDGGSHTVTVHDVVVVFVADNGSTMRTTQIGILGGPPHERYDVASFNETFSQSPSELRLRIGEVNVPQNNGFYVEGARRSSEDPLLYEQFTQDKY